MADSESTPASAAPDTAAAGSPSAGLSSTLTSLPKRGTRMKWYQRRRARTAMRTVFVLLNAVVFFVALVVLVEFVREVEQEQEGMDSTDVVLQPSPVPPPAPDCATRCRVPRETTTASAMRLGDSSSSTTTAAPSTTAAADDEGQRNLSWQERYVLLGEDVFGSNYKAVVDIYFAFVIIATFAGAFGAILRQGTFVWVAVVCYVPAWVFTLVATIGIHKHIASHPIASVHDESKARYRVALAWTWLSLMSLMLLFGLGVFLARTMREHKADRYRVSTRRRNADDDSDNDEDEDYSGDDSHMVSHVPRFTTDGSGPPRMKQVAKQQEREYQQQQQQQQRQRAATNAAGAEAEANGSGTSDSTSPHSPAEASAMLMRGRTFSTAATAANSSMASLAVGARRTAKAQPLTAATVKKLLLEATVDTLPEGGGGTQKHTCHHVYDGDTLTLGNKERVRLIGIDTPEISRFEAFAEDARAFTKRWCHGRTVFVHQPQLLEAQYETGRGNASKGNERFMTDKYGRRRAVIFVPVRKSQLLPDADASDAAAAAQQQPQSESNVSPSAATGFLNVNEALLLLGFARYYHPRPEVETPFQARFLALQRDAREAARGVWAHFVDQEVVWQGGADVFHRFVPKGASLPPTVPPPCSNGRSLAAKAPAVRPNRPVGSPSASISGATRDFASVALDLGLSPCRECHGSSGRDDI